MPTLIKEVACSCITPDVALPYTHTHRVDYSLICMLHYATNAAFCNLTRKSWLLAGVWQLQE